MTPLSGMELPTVQPVGIHSYYISRLTVMALLRSRSSLHWNLKYVPCHHDRARPRVPQDGDTPNVESTCKYLYTDNRQRMIPQLGD